MCSMNSIEFFVFEYMLFTCMKRAPTKLDTIAGWWSQWLVGQPQNLAFGIDFVCVSLFPRSLPRTHTHTLFSFSLFISIHFGTFISIHFTDKFGQKTCFYQTDVMMTMRWLYIYGIGAYMWVAVVKSFAFIYFIEVGGGVMWARLINSYTLHTHSLKWVRVFVCSNAYVRTCTHAISIQTKLYVSIVKKQRITFRFFRNVIVVVCMRVYMCVYVSHTWEPTIFAIVDKWIDFCSLWEANILEKSHHSDIA